MPGSTSGSRPSSPEVRRQFAPLNLPVRAVVPAPDAVARLQAARAASTDAFHLAMLVGVGLLGAGAAANAIGIRNADAVAGQALATPVLASGT